jgi:phosphoglycolate phosphatase
MTDMEGLTIVFDLDGTLVDTAPDLIRATNHILSGLGLEPVPGAELRPFVSLGSRRMIEHGLHLNHSNVGDDQLDLLWADFLDYYADNIAVESTPFPALESTLDALAGAGARFAVCTNKVEHLSVKLLAALGLAQRFGAICGRDTFPVCKPDPAHLTGAIAKAGGNPARAIMVGDSETDVATARAAGLPVIGVSFGYTDIPMRDLRPDELIDHYRDFEPALRRLLAATI